MRVDDPRVTLGLRKIKIMVTTGPGKKYEREIEEVRVRRMSLFEEGQGGRGGGGNGHSSNMLK